MQARLFSYVTKMNLDFEKMNGMIPAIVQDASSGRVLMLGFMNEEAFAQTVATQRVTFYSRSRNKLWCKGETSGHTLDVLEIRKDCDDDTLLIRVHANGPGVCHEGYESCFYQTLDDDANWAIADPKTYDKDLVYGDKK